MFVGMVFSHSAPSSNFLSHNEIKLPEYFNLNISNTPLCYNQTEPHDYKGFSPSSFMLTVLSYAVGIVLVIIAICFKVVIKAQSEQKVAWMKTIIHITLTTVVPTYVTYVVNLP